MCTSGVSNAINHKFSHGTAFYTLNGNNVNVMLEYCIDPKYLNICLFTEKNLENSTLKIVDIDLKVYSAMCLSMQMEGKQCRF